MNKEVIFNELQFKAVRSSGAGGQHVNKVSSKVMVSFNVANSEGLSEDEKELVIKNLTTKLSKDGLLILTCQESRSQHRNKELVVERFFNLLEKSLFIPKVRKATKPSKAKIAKRLNTKKQLSEKKENRKKLRF